MLKKTPDDLKYPSQRKIKYTLQTPANHTISFMELGSWNRSLNYCLMWGNAGSWAEMYTCGWWKMAVRRSSKIWERRRKKLKDAQEGLEISSTYAVNAVWNYVGQQTKWSHVVLVLLVVRETGFGTASENQLNCLEEPGLQQSFLFNKVLS